MEVCDLDGITGEEVCASISGALTNGTRSFIGLACKKAIGFGSPLFQQGLQQPPNTPMGLPVLQDAGQATQ